MSDCMVSDLVSDLAERLYKRFLVGDSMKNFDGRLNKGNLYERLSGCMGDMVSDLVVQDRLYCRPCYRSPREKLRI